MDIYNQDTVCQGNHKADDINSRIMELADDIAEKLALKDWGETRAGFWVKSEEGEGQSMSEEAQGIWNEYYDEYVDKLYTFTNKVVSHDREL